MDDGARALGGVDQGGVLLDAVQGLHLEAPPAGPHGRADAVGGQLRGQLVGLGGVVEGGDPVAELLGHIQHQRHFVGAVAVVLDQDRPVQHPDQGLVLQVAGRRRTLAVLAPLVPFGLVVARGDEGGAIAGHIAHAGGRALVAAAIDPRGVLAAGHLDRIGGVRELHALHGDGGGVADGHAPPAEQIGRAGQDVHGRDAAGAGGVEARILGPQRMFGPDLGGVRAGRLVAVAHAADAGRRIDAQVAVDVDDAGGDIAAARLDHPIAGRDGGGGVADRGDPAVGHHDHAVVDPAVRARQHRGADHGEILARQWLIGGRIGVERGRGIEPGGQGLVLRRRRGARIRLGGGAGRQAQHDTAYGREARAPQMMSDHQIPFSRRHASPGVSCDRHRRVIRRRRQKISVFGEGRGAPSFRHSGRSAA